MTLKRAFDVAGSCAGLLVFAPVMAVVIPAVLVDDGPPMLFRQRRLGLYRRPFSILKIRTMRDGSPTRVGRILRATGLDEIQFINILSGEMSAVGPAATDRRAWLASAGRARSSIRDGTSSRG